MPTTPTVSAAFVDAATGIEVSVTTAEAGTLMVHRRTDLGVWQVAQFLNGTDVAAGTTVLTDHWIPSEGVVEYRVATNGGGAVWSDYGISGEVPVTGLGHWLRHPTPSLSRELFITAGDISYRWKTPGNAKTPLGATDPIVIQSASRLEAITVPDVRVVGRGELTALTAMLGAGRAVWFAHDDGRGWWVRCMGGWTETELDTVAVDGARVFLVSFELLPVGGAA